MPQNFVSQIENLRRRLQRRRVFAATCWAVVGISASALVLTSLDRLLGVGDPWGRMLFTAALACVCFAVGRLWFARVLHRPVNSREIANRVEHRRPELRDVVTSALEFSQQSRNFPYGGSESLRRAVVIRADAGLEDLDWQQFVPRRPLRRAMFAAGGVLLIFGLVSWWAPQSLGIGLARLLNPLSAAEWPRENNFAFIEAPRILAAGDDLVLHLRDTRGPLPDSVDMHYRMWRDHRWHEQVHVLRTIGPSQEILRPQVQESLEYRATGGDYHTMPWQKLKVVDPPKVNELQISVQPPDYTGIPSGLLEKNDRVLAGSGLQVSGQCDQQLVSVVLRGKSGLAIPATLDPSGKLFHISGDDWYAEVSDLLSFELTTTTGLTTQTADWLALEVVPDQPPQVRFLEPIDNLSVTPAAVVPLIVAVSDDLAIRDVELVYRRSDQSDRGDQHISLFQGPEVSPPSLAGQQHQLETLWQLESLSLEPGSVVEVNARASDYQPTEGQTSHPLRLTVVSLEDLLRNLSESGIDLLQILEQLLQEERELRGLVSEWEHESDRTAQRWLDEIRPVLSRQRRISLALSDSQNGVLRSLNELIDVYLRNQLDQHASLGRLQSLHKLLSHVVDNPLVDIERLLNELIRDPKRSDSIVSLAEHQETVIDSLQQAIDSLSLENKLARFKSSLVTIEVQQQELAVLSRREILASLSHPARSEATEMSKRASLSQNRLSRRFAKLIVQMSRAIDQQSMHADNLSETVKLARELDVQTTMLAAADHLAQQQIGKASTYQQESIEHLRRLRKRLAEGRSGEKNGDNENLQSIEANEGTSPSKVGERPEGSGKAGMKPSESTSPTTASQHRVSTKVAADQLIKDLWGNLPERQREQILQPLSETFLPKYAEEIEAYFRALAEPAGAAQDSP